MGMGSAKVRMASWTLHNFWNKVPLAKLNQSPSIYLHRACIAEWGLTAFIFTTTETTFQHRLPVTHIVSLEPKCENFEISKHNISRKTWVPIKILTVLNSPRHGECRDTKILKIEASTIFCSFSVISAFFPWPKWRFWKEMGGFGF